MHNVVVLLACAALIGAVLWWFFGPHSASEGSAQQTANTLQTATITVEGGYNPQTVTLRRGVPAELVFIRKDPSNCLEEVVLPDFGVSERLPLGKPHTIAITPDKAGEYGYSCGMRMYHGTLRVEEPDQSRVVA